MSRARNVAPGHALGYSYNYRRPVRTAERTVLVDRAADASKKKTATEYVLALRFAGPEPGGFEEAFRVRLEPNGIAELYEMKSDEPLDAARDLPTAERIAARRWAATKTNNLGRTA